MRNQSGVAIKRITTDDGKEFNNKGSLGIIDRLPQIVSWVEACFQRSSSTITYIRSRQVQRELRESGEMMRLARWRSEIKNQEFSIGDQTEQPRNNSRLAKPSEKLAKGIERWSNKVYVIKSKEGWSSDLVDLSGKPADRSYRHSTFHQQASTYLISMRRLLIKHALNDAKREKT